MTFGEATGVDCTAGDLTEGDAEEVAAPEVLVGLVAVAVVATTEPSWASLSCKTQWIHRQAPPAACTRNSRIQERS